MPTSLKSSKKSAAESVISAVVCAYNEEKQLRYVLTQLLRFDVFREIICVNDGSTDKTARIIDSFRGKITPIHFPENRGKSYAMAAGVRAAKGKVIFFCDADLLTIRKSHVLGVTEPVILDRADHALAIRTDEPLIFQKLTGERAMKKQALIPQLKKMESTKYGVETFLNHLFRSKRTLLYLEDGLKQTFKYERGTGLAGEIFYADEYLKEGFEILKQMIAQKNPRLENDLSRLTERVHFSTQKLTRVMQTPIEKRTLKHLWQKEIRPLPRKLLGRI